MTSSSRPDPSVPAGCLAAEEWPPLGRRPLLATGLVVAAGALTGCGGPGGGKASGGASPSSPTASNAGGSGANGLVKLADVPVGGAVSAKAADGSTVIVAQPKAGEVVAFSAKCTHMGCTVAPAGAQLKCPCHGSVYDALTGKNVSGPAPRPLPPIQVSVTGGEVVQA